MMLLFDTSRAFRPFTLFKTTGSVPVSWLWFRLRSRREDIEENWWGMLPVSLFLYAGRVFRAVS